VGVSLGGDPALATMTTDLELAKAIQHGSQAACAEFVDRYRALCFHIVRKFVASDDEAFDLCQDTFIRALERIAQYRGESSLGTWVGRVAWNIAARSAEKTRGRREIVLDDVHEDLVASSPSTQPALDVALDAHHTMKRLESAMRTLGATEQALLTLYHLDELPIADIAAITGLPEGTIKSHLSRGRQRLKLAMQDLRMSGDDQ
jgi:RNA polymerase sigma factor (sigma-70 family)